MFSFLPQTPVTLQSKQKCGHVVTLTSIYQALLKVSERAV